MKHFRNLSPRQLDTPVERYNHDLSNYQSARVSCDGGYTWTNVKVYDDNLGKWYVWSREYGPEYVVRANGECSAREIVIDELATIPVNEVHKAYNSFDKFVEFMEAKGHDNNLALRKFCTRYDDLYLRIATHNANSTGVWDDWELDEEYQYQSNSTDSGIVYIGHYEWLSEYPGQWQILLSGELR